jgi:hypothetical protein
MKKLFLQKRKLQTCIILELNEKIEKIEKKEKIEKIEKIEKKECAICLDEIKQDNTCTTSCNHSFCLSCLLKSYKKNKTCPLCRTILLPPEEEEETKIQTMFDFDTSFNNLLHNWDPTIGDIYLDPMLQPDSQEIQDHIYWEQLIQELTNN